MSPTAQGPAQIPNTRSLRLSEPPALCASRTCITHVHTHTHTHSALVVTFFQAAWARSLATPALALDTFVSFPFCSALVQGLIFT